MEQIILIGHLLVALAIIGLIMLQQGKGADAGASFGAGGSQTVFGSDGSGNVLTKATAWLTALFFASSFSLALLANQKSTGVDELDLEIPASVEVPVLIEDEFPIIEEDLPVLTDGVSDAVTNMVDDLAEQDLPSVDE